MKEIARRTLAQTRLRVNRPENSLRKVIGGYVEGKCRVRRIVSNADDDEVCGDEENLL